MGTSEVTDAGKNMREYMCLALALITCQTQTTDSKLKRTNKLLLTAIERSFSTMNRIMNSKRCRLLPRHVSQLVKLSIEGLCISDVRDGHDTQISAVNELTDSAFSIWSRKPRRGVQ